MSVKNPLNHYAYVKEGSIVNTNGYDLQFNNSAKDLPLTSSINIEYFEQQQTENKKRLRIYALENSINRDRFKSPHFTIGNKKTQELVLISIPSIFFGSSIKKGSVNLKIHYSGTLVSEIRDYKNNGELIQTYPPSSDYTNNNSCAGIVMYNHGFIILTGSWDLGNGLRWSCFSTGSSDIVSSGSFDIDYEGINPIQTITMLSHAPKSMFNYSNNPTFLEYNDKIQNPSGNGYYELDTRKIKNTKHYPYENHTGSLERETYITKIGIYDENKTLIAIAKLAKPIKKTENRDYTFKLKLDF